MYIHSEKTMGMIMMQPVQKLLLMLSKGYSGDCAAKPTL